MKITRLVLVALTLANCSAATRRAMNDKQWTCVEARGWSGTTTRVETPVRPPAVPVSAGCLCRWKASEFVTVSTWPYFVGYTEPAIVQCQSQHEWDARFEGTDRSPSTFDAPKTP